MEGRVRGCGCGSVEEGRGGLVADEVGCWGVAVEVGERVVDGGGEGALALLEGDAGDGGSDFVARHGAGEEVALGVVAAAAEEEIALVGGFYAFGHDTHVEAVDHGDDGADDGRGVGVVDGAGYEALVDLDAVYVVLEDVGEAGEAGAKVVDGDADAEVADGLESGEDVRGVDHQHLLGDFELEGLRGEAGGVEALLYELRQVELAKLAGRKVEGHGEGITGDFLELDAILAGLAEGPLAYRDHEADFFGDGNELAGGHVAALGAGPTQKGFHARDPAGGQVDLGLVVEGELVVFEGVAEVFFELKAVGDLGLQGRAIDVKATAAGDLGFVHGGVGVVEEAGAICGVVWEEAETDAGGNADLEFSDFDRGGQGGEHFLAAMLGLFRGLAVGDEDDELVAADAGEEVGGADEALELAGDVDEDGVAAGVAEGIVDALEVVDVDHADGELALVAAGAVDGGGEFFGEQNAIGEAGEVVEAGGAGDGVAEAFEHGAGEGEDDDHHREQDQLPFGGCGPVAFNLRRNHAIAGRNHQGPQKDVDPGAANGAVEDHFHEPVEGEADGQADEPQADSAQHGTADFLRVGEVEKEEPRVCDQDDKQHKRDRQRL